MKRILSAAVLCLLIVFTVVAINKVDSNVTSSKPETVGTVQSTGR